MYTTAESRAKEELLLAHGSAPHQLLDRGMEAEVYALDDMRVLKLYHHLPAPATVHILQRFYQSLDPNPLPYALPMILAIEEQGDYTVVIERRLQGRPLAALIAEQESQLLDDTFLVRYILAVLALRTITMPPTTERYKLFDIENISSRTDGDWHRFLLRYFTKKQQELAPYFCRDVADYAFKAQQMQQLLSTPYAGVYCLIHGDFFPGNVLVDTNGQPTALLDFGLFTMYGDPLFDLATACAFFDMYDELNLNLRMRLFDLVCAQIGEHVRPLLYRYLLLYSFLAANTYSPDCSDGHYAWSVANLNNRDYWSLVI